MKLKHCMLLLALFGLSFNALANEKKSPNDFAYGMKLTINNEQSMFSQVALTEFIYEQTVSPDLNDVRVFDQRGNSVPFSLVNVSQQQKSIEKKSMSIYPLDGANPNENISQSGNNYRINIEGKDIKINIDRPANHETKHRVSYFLHAPDEDFYNKYLAKFELNFAKSADNWKASVKVSCSYNLKYWSNVVDDVPLMNLVNRNEQKLSITDISMSSSSNYPYWLITIDSEMPIPDLNQVFAIFKIEEENYSRVPLHFSMTESNSDQAIYTLKSPQRVQDLRLGLPYARSLLPVKIYYKSTNEQKDWIKLSEKILRSMNSQDYAEIKLNNQLVQQIKLEPLTGSFDSKSLPNIIAMRNQVNLVFASANNGPFILAWGSFDAKKEALPISQLLSAEDKLSNVPTAYMTEGVNLGGEKMLNPQESTSSGFPKWIIWLGLIVAAGLLVLLALRLVKEINKQP